MTDLQNSPSASNINEQINALNAQIKGINARMIIETEKNNKRFKILITFFIPLLILPIHSIVSFFFQNRKYQDNSANSFNQNLNYDNTTNNCSFAPSLCYDLQNYQDHKTDLFVNFSKLMQSYENLKNLNSPFENSLRNFSQMINNIKEDILKCAPNNWKFDTESQYRLEGEKLFMAFFIPMALNFLCLIFIGKCFDVITKLKIEGKTNNSTLISLYEDLKNRISKNDLQIIQNFLKLLRFYQDLKIRTSMLINTHSILSQRVDKIAELKVIPGPKGVPGPQGSEGPIGTVIFHSTPTNDISNLITKSVWVPCDGRLLLKSQYPELYAIIGVTFGSLAADSFNIPDIRGRTIVGAGIGVGLSNRVVGSIGGSETVTLEKNQMPKHCHYQGSESLYNFYGGGNKIGQRNWGSIHGYDTYTYQATSSEGENQPHENMMPFLVLFPMIRIQ